MMSKRMTDPNKGMKKHHLDLAGVEAAMKRAAAKARQRAKQAGQGIIVWKDGRVVELWEDGRITEVEEDSSTYE